MMDMLCLHHQSQAVHSKEFVAFTALTHPQLGGAGKTFCVVMLAIHTPDVCLHFLLALGGKRGAIRAVCLAKLFLYRCNDRCVCM